jgi:penicillin-binding protein 1A
MKKNYAIEELGISKEDFEKPANMSIETDCAKFNEGLRKDIDLEEDLEDLDF